MNNSIKHLLERPFYRYMIIGGLIYIFELIVILISQMLGSTPTFAVGLSFWLGLIMSFGLQKIVTFGDKQMHHKVLLPQIMAFSLLVLFNFGFTIAVTELLSPAIPAVITRTIALAITTIWNFYLYKTQIFKTSNIDTLIT